MKQERRERAQQLANDLQKSTAHEALMLKEWISLLFEEAKHSLVSAEGDGLLRLQGEARSLEKLLSKLTRAAPQTAKE